MEATLALGHGCPRALSGPPRPWSTLQAGMSPLGLQVWEHKRHGLVATLSSHES